MLKRRKVIVKLLLLTMCTSMSLTTTSFAETVETINNQLTNSVATSEADFTFDASTGTIVKYIGTNPTVVIPSTINGVPVKIIGDEAFLDNIHITSVEIPSGVIKIGWYSFYRCYGLTKLIIPDTVTSIDKDKSVLSSDKTLFYVASENVKQILMNNCRIEERKIRVNGQLPITFRFDANTGTITKYNGVDTAVVIPSALDGISVKSIGDKAFQNNDDITSVEIPNGVTNVGNYTFSGCENLTKVTIPNSVTRIEDSTFYGCSSLINITIPNGVTNIGKWAFEYCNKLTSIIIPDSITNIGENAFYECSNALFYVKSEATKQLLINNGINESRIILTNSGYNFDSATKTIKKYIGTEANVVIPSTINGAAVENIGTEAFRDNNNLISVEIPSGVISIENSAFAGCRNLTSITLSNSLTSIDAYAFSDCTHLTSIKIPNSVTSIQHDAFRYSNIAAFYVESEAIKQLLIDSGVDESKIVLNGQAYTIKVSSIVINATTINLRVGQTETFTATVLPSNAVNKELTWRSSNELVATVDSNGKVTGIGSGSATITCTANDGSGVVSNIGITVSAQSTSNLGLKSVSITGTEKVGHKLKAKINYDGTEPSSLMYKWQRASRIDGNFQDIDGAYDNEYKLKSVDKNKYIRLVVTEVINGRIFTLEDMTGRIKAYSSDNTEEEDNTSSNSSSNNTSSNSSNNVVLRPRTNTSSSLNSQSPANGRFRNPSGGKVTGWIDTADGKWYYLDPNGDVVTGWVQFNDRWYYLNPNNDAKRGVMMTGWIRDNGNWYYLYSNGQMAGGTTIDGYTLDYTGKMIE